MNTTNTLSILSEFLKIQGNKFVTLTYRNKQGELSKYTIFVGALLKNTYEKDIKTLEKIVPTNEIETIARQELIDSMKTSIETNFNNPEYTKLNYYDHITRNVKFHENTLYVNSFVLSREVIEQGTYKTVNSSPKTIAKNKFRKMLKMSKFREFRIDVSQINSLSINGKRLVIN
jgi:hypothetical protein